MKADKELIFHKKKAILAFIRALQADTDAAKAAHLLTMEVHRQAMLKLGVSTQIEDPLK